MLEVNECVSCVINWLEQERLVRRSRRSYSVLKGLPVAIRINNNFVLPRKIDLITVTMQPETHFQINLDSLRRPNGKFINR